MEDTRILMARTDERVRQLSEDVGEIKHDINELVKTNQRISLVEADILTVKDSTKRAHERIDVIRTESSQTIKAILQEALKLVMVCAASALLAHFSIRAISAQELPGSTAVLSISPDYHLTAGLGYSYQTRSEVGTWWDYNYPHSLNQGSYFGSIGLQGPHWSVEYADLGRETVYCLCSGTAFYGAQHPRGIWAAFEPQLDRVFLRLGGGVYRPGFREYVSNQSEVGNNIIAAGWLGGVGYRFGSFDLVTDARYIGARRPAPEPVDFPAIGKFDFAVYVRGRL